MGSRRHEEGFVERDRHSMLKLCTQRQWEGIERPVSHAWKMKCPARHIKHTHARRGGSRSLGWLWWG